MATFNVEGVNTNKGNRIDISKFTSDQSVAYTKLMEFINSPFDKNNFKRALIGALAVGWSMGTYKMLLGDHFLSHTIITMIIAWFIILIIVKSMQFKQRQKLEKSTKI